MQVTVRAGFATIFAPLGGGRVTCQWRCLARLSCPSSLSLRRPPPHRAPQPRHRAVLPVEVVQFAGADHGIAAHGGAWVSVA